MLSDMLIGSLPRYETKIPSSKKSLTFRPFLVRDEKTLLITLETSDKKETILTLINLIKNCYENIEDINELYMSDLEHLLLELRSKSIGDVVDFGVISNDGSEIDVSINLSEDIQVVGEYGDKEIDLGNNISCKFRHPKVKDFITENFDENNPDDFLKIMGKCLIEITNKEETINTENYSVQERIDFIESMNKKQFESVLDHFSNTPKLVTVKTYIEDGEEKQIRFEGLKDFFV